MNDFFEKLAALCKEHDASIDIDERGPWGGNPILVFTVDGKEFSAFQSIDEDIASDFHRLHEEF